MKEIESGKKDRCVATLLKEQIALQGNQTNMSLHLVLALENEVTKLR